MKAHLRHIITTTHQYRAASPFTPLVTNMWAELVADHIPKGVVNILSGGNAAGAWLEAFLNGQASLELGWEDGRLVRGED